MRGLASHILRGRMPAILTVAALAVLALAVPLLGWPLTWFSAGGVALVTLQQGAREGGIVVAGATALVGVLGMLFGAPGLAPALLVGLWLPIWVAAAATGASRSLALGLMICSLIGVLIVLGVWVVLDDPVRWWQNYIHEALLPVLEQAGILADMPADFEARLNETARIMTGAMAASGTFGLSLGLVIGRWWQSVVTRPGAFGEEFRRLRLGRIVSLLMLAVVLGAAFLPAALALPLVNLVPVLAVPFLMQGLALIHVILGRRPQDRGWLIGFYVLLVLFMPWSLVFVAVLGWLDNGLDFRARLPAGVD